MIPARRRCTSALPISALATVAASRVKNSSGRRAAASSAIVSVTGLR